MSRHLDLNISQKDESFCSKLGLEVEDAKFIWKALITRLWMICHILPYVKVGQTTCLFHFNKLPTSDKNFCSFEKFEYTIPFHKSRDLLDNDL